MKKKLIEVALPLEAINAAAAYEKMPGIGPHPRGLHLWWARRPLTAARAVIWSSLVDDPSSNPEQFPTEEDQEIERKRLFAILSRLVLWRNSNDSGVIEEARAEIRRSLGDDIPALLDPFAGGGAIPLEAQRLGLNAHACDLNPVAVMINKSMIEIPPVFANRCPVNPEWQNRMDARSGDVPKGTIGLAEDVLYYGKWMQKQVLESIGHLYPKVKMPPEHGNGESNVIAWLWARTVKCPNPACGCEIPLMKSFELCKKKGREACVEPTLVGNKYAYRVLPGKPKHPGTISRSGGACPACGSSIDFPYIRTEAQNGRMGDDLIAVVAEAKRGRVYLSPDVEQIRASRVEKPTEYPSGVLSGKSRVNVSLYGFDETGDLFSARQLTALNQFSDLVCKVRKVIEKDAEAAGMFNDHITLSDGGTGARAYSEAVSVYLAFAVDRLADFSTSVSRWSISNEKAMNCFSKQAIPMTWDHPEVNILGTSVGGFSPIVEYIVDCIKELPENVTAGNVRQFDAQSDNGLRNIMISTDPPYYDNIDYADLSDFFYVWMRQALKEVYPKLFRTMLVPKAEELVATPYRFDGSVEKARNFFEDGMYRTCCQIYTYARDDIPVTIYYAFKQSESETNELSGESTASTGWETMLSAIIRAGFAITGTWPMRTEQAFRAVSMGTNALASSIVLVCRKRDEAVRSVTRREFINALHREMRPALEKLQSANIAPVDLAQSAIGPGIGVFSRYKSVLEADGTPMSVRSALQIINQELDSFYNEQEGELDRESRFCVDLFNQYAFNNIKFGDADILARAKNTSVQALADHGVLTASKGQVRLLTRDEIPEKVDVTEECTWLLTQQLARAMEKGGVKECARIVVDLFGSNAENAKALAYRLYTICERKNWAQEGFAYNNLVVAWPDIQAMAAAIQAETPVQLTMESLITEE